MDRFTRSPVFTGTVLFEAETEMAQIARHVSHDGSPPPLAKLAKRKDLAALTKLLTSTLRQNPDNRPTATAVRKELAKLAPLYGLTYDDAMTAAVEAAYPRVSAAGPAQ